MHAGGAPHHALIIPAILTTVSGCSSRQMEVNPLVCTCQRGTQPAACNRTYRTDKC